MKNKKSKNKFRFVTVVFILIIIFGFIAYSNRSLLQFGAFNTSKAVFSFETLQQYKFDSLRSNILALNGEGITCMSQSGEQLWNIMRQTTNPSMQVEGSYTLLFDRGGKGLSVLNNGSLMWEFQTDQPIITAKVNSKGYTAVVTYDVGYKGKIEIYDIHGELVYKWQLGENYIVDVDISPDCKSFVAATISPNDVKLTSKITVIDINGEKIAGEVQLSDCLVIMIKYQSDGTLVALGEDELVGISAKCEEKWTVDFEGRELQKFKIPFDTSCVLTFAGSRNNSVVEVYNREGKKSGEYTSDSEIKSIDVSDKTISAVEKRNVILLNLKGNVTSQTQMQKDIHEVVIFANNKVAVVESNAIEIIKP